MARTGIARISAPAGDLFPQPPSLPPVEVRSETGRDDPNP